MSEQPKIYITGLAPDVAEHTLRKEFKRFGEITDIFIRPKDTFAFAFITYESMDQAEDAIKGMAGKSIQGQRLKIAMARPKQPRAGGNNGGGDRPKGCFKCGQEGHFARQCPSQGGDNNFSRGRGRGRGGSSNDRGGYSNDRGGSSNDRGFGNQRQNNDRGRNGSRSKSKSHSPVRKNKKRSASGSRSRSPQRPAKDNKRNTSQSRSRSPQKKKVSRSRSNERRKNFKKRSVSKSSRSRS